MNYAKTYLEKHNKGFALISKTPAPGLKYIITIPAYLETRLRESLVSLLSCTPPSSDVEVIIVINWPRNESPENIALSKNIIVQVEDWIRNNTKAWIRFHCLVLPGVPVKTAGVGFTRKTAMDEAVRRFLLAGQDDGIIISFDGDTICDPDYLISIESHFLRHTQTDGCTVYFEHPLEGSEFPPEVYQGISQYELHLRYYLHSLRYTGFPNAFYTVGSAFAVRAKSYCRQGGMNIKKVGEDFYFLQKLADLGAFTELNTTRIIPSPRPSFRVPFGTGAAIENFLKGNEVLPSYNPGSFDVLKRFFEILPVIYHSHQTNVIPVIKESDETLGSYLETIDFNKSLEEIKNNSSGYETFRKRFFRFFNMFRILKFLNYARKYYPDMPVTECSAIFLAKNGIEAGMVKDAKSLLEIFRRMDRQIIPQR